MSEERATVEKTLLQALTGKGAHVDTAGALEGLDWKRAGEKPSGAPYSVFQVVNHLIYWQDFVREWLDGEMPPIPKHDPESWPGEQGPTSEAEWEGAVARFREGIEELSRRVEQADLFAPIGARPPVEIFQLIATHNSYHIGQVAMLRRALGAWPPPGGGLSW